MSLPENAINPGIPQDEAQTWRPLRHFNYYRLTLSFAIFIFFKTEALGGFLGQFNPDYFLTTSLTFFFSSLIFIFIEYKKIIKFEAQVILASINDILLITLMMHYSGGLISALSILLVINIVATGTFLRSRDSYLFAAVASITVLFEQTYNFLNNIAPASVFAFAGIMGLVFFGSSMLASILSQRAREYEKLASQQSVDLINLEKLNENIIQNMRTGILVVDNSGHIRMANSSAESILGNLSLKDNPLLENILPSLDARFLEWQQHPQMYHKAISQQQGLPDIQPGFRSLDNTSPYAGDTLIFLEDATRLNQRFQQIKLASLGKLTASIAHEIRNPLSGINHASQLLSESNLDPADKKLTDIISTQVHKLDKVINNVLQLSRQDRGAPESIDLKNWLENFKKELIENNGLQEKQLIIKVKSNSFKILFDSSHLYQIICNLTSNAISHNDKPQSKVSINMIIGFDDTEKQPYLDVIDNGPGIPKELSEQIFDPFFTTNSQGTGLGLYISKEIVESNRGKMRYLGVNDQGNCFRIQFLSSTKD
ncbi:MAG: ATP-binding protein [Gammaproteobacteria bacterium]|nr:ATP-binding protein [Gammaproteobacteria bacterium]